jgi:ferredoxin
MTKIFYFSGTGNTLWSAKKIAELLGGCELFNIGIEMRKPPETIEAERIIFLFPAYAYQSPLLVRRFLTRSEIRSPYVAAIVTFGTDPGGALAEVHRVLNRKKIKVSFFGSIPSVENYIPIFGPPRERKKRERLAMQMNATEEMARALGAQRTNRVWPVRPLSICVSSLLRIAKPLFVKGFKVAIECNGCGICAAVCPACNIAMKGQRPVFSPGCEHCQACLNWCPRRAIRYIRMKPDTPRYHHPEVGLTEMFCRAAPGSNASAPAGR